MILLRQLWKFVAGDQPLEVCGGLRRLMLPRDLEGTAPPCDRVPRPFLCSAVASTSSRGRLVLTQLASVLTVTRAWSVTARVCESRDAHAPQRARESVHVPRPTPVNCGDEGRVSTAPMREAGARPPLCIECKDIRQFRCSTEGEFFIDNLLVRIHHPRDGCVNWSRAMGV
jgi:hypothetical protein